MSRSVRILLVEDNPADADLTLDSFEDSDDVEVMVARDGLEALDILHRRGRFAEVPLPDLIVLDLNLPKMHGSDVLAALRSARTLKRIPVIVLTSSDSEQDVKRSYDAGANCYVKKPLDLRAFQQIIKAVEEFWFSVAKLPPTAR